MNRQTALTQTHPVDQDDAPLLLQLPNFEGDLGELAQALRSGRLLPQEVDLLAVVRAVLARFDAFVRDDLERATELLPRAAQVVELKTRLLLPRPPRAEVEDDDALEEVLAAVAELEALEEAIAQLRARREERRLLLTARAPTPTYPRRPRPLGVPLARLAELAGRLRTGAYFEFHRDRLSLASAMQRMLSWLLPGRRRLLDELVEGRGWEEKTVYFTGALELVREGKLRLHQEATFGDIEMERLEGAATETA